MAYRKFPEFSWSLSRHKTFSTCKKQYAFAYYQAHNGWLANSSDLAKQTYRLKKIVTLPILFGQIIHDLIAKTLQKFYQQGYISSEQELILQAKDLLNNAYIDSTRYRSEWFARPSKRTMLYDLYYGNALNLEEVQYYKNLIPESIKHFFMSETWQQFSQAPTQAIDFKQLEDFSYMYVNDSKIYVVLDMLFVDARDGYWYIIDWKTGKPSPSDSEQLLLYAHYLQLHYKVPLEKIRLRNEYLATATARTFTPDQRAVDNVLHTFNMSTLQMKSYMADILENEPLPLEDFPRTVSSFNCLRCNYKEICQPNLTS